MNVIILTHCPMCGKENFIPVESTDYDRWRKGELAQVAFPYLSPTERECLISDFCPECQEKVFGE